LSTCVTHTTGSGFRTRVVGELVRLAVEIEAISVRIEYLVDARLLHPDLDPPELAMRDAPQRVDVSWSGEQSLERDDRRTSRTFLMAPLVRTGRSSRRRVGERHRAGGPSA
jgi:hypothetical protein